VAPCQAAKVAQEAGKAAPAIAVAGALTVAPQARKRAPHGRAAAKQVALLDAHLARWFTVRSGDTMPGIAQRLYGLDAARPAPPAAAPRGRLPGMTATGRAGTTGAPASLGRGCGPPGVNRRACLHGSYTSLTSGGMGVCT
jgi:hypothetical protein